MYKIIVISDSNKHFSSAINEYEKRLAKKIDVIKLKPIKNLVASQTIKQETNLIISKLSKLKGFKIILNPAWNRLDTKKLFSFLENKKHSFPNIIFIVGWVNWLDYSLLNSHVNYSLSLGEMTMPHSLALLVVLEQIYRLEMIKKGTDYDK